MGHDAVFSLESSSMATCQNPQARSKVVGKVLAARQQVQRVIYSRKGEDVHLRNGVQPPVVNAEACTTIFFGHKNNWAGPGTFRGQDHLLLEHLLHHFLYFPPQSERRGGCRIGGWSPVLTT